MRMLVQKCADVQPVCIKQNRHVPLQHSAPEPSAAAQSITSRATVLNSRRHLLLAGASLAFAPLTAQQALSHPAVHRVVDSPATSFRGFDGVGGSDSDYAVAELTEIAVGNNGGVASVRVDGFDQLMPIFIGVAEAAALVYATTHAEGRRPSTLGTWKSSLEATGSRVERVVITRLVDHTYYSRIVLKLPGGSKRSVDSRPSDSLALAMQCEAPLFVARQLAEEQQMSSADEALEEVEELQVGEGLQEASLRNPRRLQAVAPYHTVRVVV